MQLAMRKTTRRLLLAGALATVAACGFTPVYGPGGDGLMLRSAVRVAEPSTDFDFAFTRQFEARLGRPTAARYDLTYVIVTEETGLAIDGSNNITRFDLEGRMTWTLTAEGGVNPALRGIETAFTAYSATGSTISTLESERDAETRLAAILADKVVTRLLSEADGL
ncbi:LPS assembly lipoprotein LptE [Jannaschia sp. M317]|uniref:LPS assembly lipoprotein LptE n=1 Tax=Jannaschia sp. M317 TaxID=2867011 RepID=UPI0021A7C1B9|nr:LPS assembly lipoprotein LptE [Jannaschia sp. M317]UWQ18130.1 hypothetical protein K3551_02135 [Jannaschia sp. M317]